MTTKSLSFVQNLRAATGAVAGHVPVRVLAWTLITGVLLTLAALSSWSANDPSLSYATNAVPRNWLGYPGAIIADLLFQSFGLAAVFLLFSPAIWAFHLLQRNIPGRMGLRCVSWMGATFVISGILACTLPPATWPLTTGIGGLVGDGFIGLASMVLGRAPAPGAELILYAIILTPPALALFWLSVTSRHAMQRPKPGDEADRIGPYDIILGAFVHTGLAFRTAWRRSRARYAHAAAKADTNYRNPQKPADTKSLTRRQNLERQARLEPHFEDSPSRATDREPDHGVDFSTLDQDVPLSAFAPEAFVENAPAPKISAPAARAAAGKRQAREAQGSLLENEGFELPPLQLLAEPRHVGRTEEHKPERLEVNARLLEGVLDDFGVKGDIINVRPGPVVTLYELEPAPGIKSSRVISLADDIARSMSAISARVAVVPGRNAIGIELPNQTRETVFLREMLASADFERQKGKLNICLGKTIGGEPVIADLARMPHLLVAGTTGSGKSVAINTMILSLLYRLTPEQCRVIMIDPKMLELSIYDGIPHLLTPVVTDPSKAVVALKWAVREMEDRYRKMSKIGVRNIDGFNARVTEAGKKGETITRTVQTGFDKETGEALFESETFELEPIPYIVVIVDEMADLMMVAGKDIEGAIQRLAQMARAAGIHLIMATQRPSVDVITGTIKANFPTRISFQVTSKIDSRTILGEQGGEQLLGNGDMLYMAGGGRIRRLHGPFVSDREVEDVVSHLKSQGVPDYLESITAEDEFDDPMANEFGGSGDELYDKAVNVVLQDQKASTSYIQRRLSIGYNRAATLIERMEKEGVISAANHAGKREVLAGDGSTY